MSLNIIMKDHEGMVMMIIWNFFGGVDDLANPDGGQQNTVFLYFSQVRRP